MKLNAFTHLFITLFALSFVAKAHSQSFIVRVVQFFPLNLNRATFRCFGTVFTPNHVITTANCVTVLFPLEIACQHQEAVRSPDGTMIRTRKKRKSMVNIQ